MRYSIFSDIHANLVAWQAALADMEELETDVYVCLGDVVGYGPCPQEVLSAIRQRTEHFVIVNHDAAASGVLSTSLFNENARAVIEWTRDQLDEESIQFLLDTPLKLEAEDLLFVHAEVCEPGKFGYIDSVVEAVENFTANHHFVTFVGHTHHPTIFELNSDGGVQQLPDEDCTLDPNKRYIINVGSVGEPRNPDDLRSRYVIYDSDTCEVFFRRIVFDTEAYRGHLHASGLHITPYFLTVVDHYRQAAESYDEQEMWALTHDMEAPLEVAGTFQDQAQQMVIEVDPITAARQKPKPKPRPISAQQRKVGALPFVLIFTSMVALLGAGWYFLFGREQLANDPAAADPFANPTPMIVDSPNEIDPKVADPKPVPAPNPAPTGPEATLRNGLVAQWKLNDSPGTKWYSDSAGNDLDLYLEGAESVANGVTGRAQKFDGKDDRMTSATKPFEGRGLKK
ncbi:MAG: metallophosphoesterase family protein, partial [Verrucomicrobiota bacterium]